MKNVILFVLLSMGFYDSHAQEITSVQNRVFGGDSLMIRQMDLGEFDIQGKKT